MDYQAVTIWTVIKKFILGWLVAGGLLVIISCVKYKEFIIAAFSSNTLAWVNALMPIAIMIYGIWLIMRTTLK